MISKIINQNGAPINGSESITARGAKMSLNAVVVRTPLSSGLSSMVIKHLSNHLSTWCTSIPDATCRIHQLDDLIYFSTNSADLLDQYARYEAPYIAYVIEADEQSDECEMWDPKQAA